MDQTSTADLLAFLSEAGLRAFSEVDLLRGFCERVRKAGVPVARALVLIDTLHPVHEGHVFRWRREGEAFEPVTEYGRVSDGGDAAEKWAVSPFHHLLAANFNVFADQVLTASTETFRMATPDDAGALNYAIRGRAASLPCLPMEPSPSADDLEGRAGARLRQHRRGEARGGNADHGGAARRAATALCGGWRRKAAP